MMGSAFFAAMSIANIVIAMPTLAKRDVPSAVQILNYALTLEHLENTFYRQGLATFVDEDFTAAGINPAVRDEMVIIGQDETQHVNFLTTVITALNATPVHECTYNFNVTDVRGFIATASLLEGIGVSAYLGAAADIMATQYLTAAAAVLTTEARHSSYLRSAMGQTPFAKPFDDPLDYSQVYSLAAMFIDGCNSTTDLQNMNVTMFSPLVVHDDGCPDEQMYQSNSTVLFDLPDFPSNVTDIYAAWISLAGPIFQNVSYTDSGLLNTTVPEGVNGQTYVVLTSDDSGVTDDNTLAGPAVLEISNY